MITTISFPPGMQMARTSDIARLRIRQTQAAFVMRKMPLAMAMRAKWLVYFRQREIDNVVAMQ